MVKKPNNIDENSVKVKKRGPGRPKKRGPKKKRKSRAKPKPDGRHSPKSKNTTDYKIISCHNGKQNGYLGRYKTASEAYEDLERLKSERASVVFPKMIENSGEIRPCRYEYVLLEKNRRGDKKSAKLQNEYGVFIQQETNSEKWVVYDKVRYYIEETFWVYGMNPRTDRKTFSWIYDNMILEIGDDAHNFVRVSVYKNKIILKYDDGTMNLILCKCQSDSIRFYNKVREMKKKDSRIIMCGSEESSKERSKSVEDELIRLTGWPLHKIQMRKTKR